MNPPWRREEVIGPCRLLLGDARECLPALDKAPAAGRPKGEVE